MDRIGKYEILDEIGAGGFGTVYRGRDPILKRMVAIKTCSSEDDLLRQRFRREAEIVAGLQHPNITTIHDLGEQDGVPYLVQEFLDGEDLSHIIGRRDDLSYDQRARLLYGVASGLAHAHANGIIHRDIKPSNVRVLSNGSVKVMDFGIAKIGDVQTELTRTGMMLGTGPYLAPEQLTDEQLDNRCDIFSFGVVAYELFAYQRPFEASTFSALLYKILNQPHTPIREMCPGLGEPLVELVERCLIKDRERRIASFEEIRSQLAQVLNISEERQLPTSSQVFLDPTVSYDSGSTQRTTVEPHRTDENSATVMMSSAEASAAAMREAARRAPSDVQSAPVPKPGQSRAVPTVAAAVIVAGLAIATAVWLSRGDQDGGSTATGPAAPSTASVAAAPDRGQTEPEANASSATSTAPSEQSGPAPSAGTPGTEPSSRASGATPEPATPPPSTAPPSTATPSTARERPSGDSVASERSRPQARPGTTAEPEPSTETAATSPAERPTPVVTTPEPAAAQPSPATPAATVPAEPVPTPVPATPEPEPAAPPTPDPAVEEAGIRTAIDRYRRAWEALDIDALAAAWPSLDSDSKSRIARGFGSYQELTMTIDSCTFDVTGASAVARCAVHQQVTPKGGRQLTSDREVEFRLAKRGGNWVIEDA